MTAFLAFSQRGEALAHDLCAALGGTVDRAGKGGTTSLSQWTAEHFAAGHRLIYVGAVGIAVRAIAPYLKSKATDPAVVVVDELGRFAVPVVSGHLGGANDLARTIGELCGALPIITTATDLNGLFAVDDWARRQGCLIPQPHKIKTVSARMLAGELVRIYSALPIWGTPPKGVTLCESGPCHALVDLYQAEEPAPLPIVPKVGVLGVGCRRGTSIETLEEAFSSFCEEKNLWPQSICAAASIDLKAEEPGLLAFCAAHGWTLHTYSADELRQVEGTFTPSPFVAQTTGVDNVCERAAVKLAAGPLLEKKFAGNGVTLALAMKPVTLDWRWQYE